MDCDAEQAPICYVEYTGEDELPTMVALIEKELSEPYSIFTYRYFTLNWKHLCVNAKCGETTIGTIVCKAEMVKGRMRGYVAMLVVDSTFRRRGIGTELVKQAMERMKTLDNCDEIVLETEECNKSALRLYEGLGFVRDKLLMKYYLNGSNAYRLKLYIKFPDEEEATEGAREEF